MSISIRALGSAALLALALLPSAASAHTPSDSYLALRADGSSLRGQWDVALRDLELAVGLDADGDAQITWGELRARREGISAYALSRLQLSAGGAPCPSEVLALRADRHSDGAYAVLDFRAECATAPREIEVTYSLLFELDAQHRGLLRLDAERGTQTAIFASDARTRRLELGNAARGWTGFADYLREGVWHIAIGNDHLLFLLSLLLPAVLRREKGRWEPVDSLPAAITDAWRVVSAFTAAHSITLALASLQLVQLPSRWVESAIAASVVVAALHNLFPLWDRARWRMAFGFGLIHGMGFASVLGDLGLPERSLVSSLLGFNLGVELGQLAGVAAFLPLAYALRHRPVYRRLGVVAGSGLIALLGSLWFVERALDLQLWIPSF